MVSKAIASRIGKLAERVQELREGERFEITRLTRIKALCEEPQAAADFAMYVARLTWDKMRDAECPDNLIFPNQRYYNEMGKRQSNMVTMSSFYPDERHIFLAGNLSVYTYNRI